MEGLRITRRVRHHKLIEKTCEHPGCGKIYYGVPTRKYCDHHKDPKNRDQTQRRRTYVKKSEDRESKINTVYEHSNFKVIEKTFVCALCGSEYVVKIFPRQFVYPKFCECHRNEYKRCLYTKNKEACSAEQKN